jgi:raffinose/stachyose/melibiose transport system permease protein
MKRKRSVLLVAKHVFLLLVSIVFLLPFVIIFLGAFKTGAEAKLMRLSLPGEVIWWDNFAKVIERGNLIRSFFNSALYSICGTGGGVLLSALAAFVLSRRRTPLNNAVYFFMIMGIVLPVNMAALIQAMKQFALMGTQIGIILLYIATTIPMALFIIYGFIATVPRDLDEAALIDGASPIRMFVFIVLPLLKPVLVTVSLLGFTGIWNDFQTPLYVLNTTKYWPMTLAIYNFFGMYENDWNYIFADIVLTCLPAIIVYLIGQKQIISGLMSGAVKG